MDKESEKIIEESNKIFQHVINILKRKNDSMSNDSIDSICYTISKQIERNNSIMKKKHNISSVCDFVLFQQMKDKQESAKWEYNYVSQKLERTNIETRAAEVLSQVEPLRSIFGENVDKDKIRKLLDYVVGGNR